MTYFSYKGKEYTSLAAMPPDVQKAYAKWRAEQHLPDDLLDFYESELQNLEAENSGDRPLPGPKPASGGQSKLPATCPHCGGPIHSAQVKSANSSLAVCPYCGLNLAA